MPLLIYNPENPIDQQTMPVFQLEHYVAALARAFHPKTPELCADALLSETFLPFPINVQTPFSPPIAPDPMPQHLR